MGVKARKALKKVVKKGSLQVAVASQNDSADFLPLEGGRGRKLLMREEPVNNTATVLYVGRIPHGFYEEQMEGFFSQFGSVRRLRIARNKKGCILWGMLYDDVDVQFHPVSTTFEGSKRKASIITGKSKHYGFIEFESAEVAKIVADSMHNYLLYEHLLQVYPIPPDRVHPKLWNGANRKYNPPNWVNIQRKQHDKERTVEGHQRMVARILKREQKRRRRIEAAGIDYECPEIVGSALPAPKKIKFVEE